MEEKFEFQTFISDVHQRNFHFWKKKDTAFFLWSVFFRIRIKYGNLLYKSPHAVRMRENTDQKTPNTDTFYAVRPFLS